ncbi:phosphoadenosine phosphosulfate reductase family protein [Bacillus sp. Wb]
MNNNKLGTEENPRHIVGLSGGKDSSALAIWIKQTRPDIHEKVEYYFTDTQKELPEVTEYLDKLEVYLGKPIQYIKATVGDKKRIQFTTEETEIDSFDDVLYNKYNGFLPAPMSRWCTRDLKIIPMEQWIGEDHCISYVGLRADEPERTGYVRKGKSNITPVYPFREDGLGINEIFKLLETTIGIPEYYKWRTRSGCTFCFFQRRVEYSILFHLYPDLFKDAQKYESEHDDGRIFSWIKDRPLSYVAENSKDIIKRYIKKQYKKSSEEYKQGYTMTLEEMLQCIDEDRIREFIDTWDLKRLHDVDGENKDGCTVCAI